VIVAYIVVKLDISNGNHQQQQNQIPRKIFLQRIVPETSYLSSYKNFYFALKSKEVKRQYSKLLGLILDYNKKVIKIDN